MGGMFAAGGRTEPGELRSTRCSGLQTSGNASIERRRSEHGASVVEMAIILPLLVMLLLGIVSSGIAFNHQLSLTHAAREGGRYGATLPVTNFGSIDAWLDSVAGRVLDDATGTLSSTTQGLLICVAFVHPDGTTRSRTQNTSGATYSGSPCFADGRPGAERRVQVTVAREVDFNALVFQTTLTLDSQAVNRFEAALGL